MVRDVGSVWCFECSLNVSICWITLEAFDALNVPWMFAYGELLWSVWCIEYSLNVRILWVTLEVFAALNVPWIFAYGELLWKRLMLWMFIEFWYMVSYFGSFWCFECLLNVSIWWVTLEAIDALNVPWMLA